MSRHPLTRFTQIVMLLAMLSNCFAEQVHAINFTYVGPNNGSWQTPQFWAPFVPPGIVGPPNFGDSAVINNNVNVELDANVLGLTGLVIANQGDVFTGGHQLSVVNIAGTTDTNIVGTGTTGNNTELFVQPNGGSAAFVGDRVNLTNGGELDLTNGGIAHVTNRLDVDALSILTGDGRIVFTDTHNVNGRRLDLRGTIRPDANDTIELVAESGTIDLDGQVHNDNLVDLTNVDSRLIVDGPLTDSFTGTIEMGSGSTLTMRDDWTHGPLPGGAGGASRIEFDPGDGNTATINGQGEMTIGGLGEFAANIDALSGNARITSDAVIQSNADIDVFSGARLDFDGEVTYTGAASITGLGEFDPGTENNVNGNVTIATSTINFDAGDWDLTRHLTLNVDTIDDVFGNHFGLVNPGNPSIDIHSQAIGDNGRLTVNLPAGDAWTLAEETTMNVTAPSGNLAATNLTGSEFHIEGNLNIDGNSMFSAPVDLEQTGIVTLADADSSWTLNSDSQLSGGGILGDGRFRSNSAAVTGRGTIQADVDFSGSAELIARGGELNITGNINDLGTAIGAENGGRLRLGTTNFSTGLVDEVRLDSGEWVDGGDTTFVQNVAGGLIRGNGTINVESINNHGTIAADGGTLEILDRLDWDGSSLGPANEGDGVLSAQQGDLFVRTMHQGPSFVGTIMTADSHTFTYAPYSGEGHILFDDATGDGDAGGDVGRLSMTGGTLVADEVTHEGEFNISGATSTIVADEILFDSLGSTHLDSRLLLNTSGGTLSAIEAGATFTGSSELVNTLGSRLAVADEANVDVGIVNRGEMHVGYGPFVSEVAGDIEVQSFEQTGHGTLEINLAGIGLEEYDRIDAADSAMLDGILNVSLLDGFEPALGDEFTILETAAGSISGIFADVNTPVFNDLTLSIAYDASSVVLSVINFDPADLNKDGFVDGLDLGILLGNWDMNVDPEEGELSGMPPVDGLDLGILLGAWNPPPAPIAAFGTVPEPTTLTLLLLSLAVLGNNTRRNR